MTRQRDNALDIVKGALVLVMVVYHWGTYFVGAQSVLFFSVLRFVTPSFIFITGAVISLILVPGYGTDDHREPLRLLFRGLKLIVLFLVLNLALEYLLPQRTRAHAFGLPSFSGSLPEIFLSGNRNTASFRIFVPIGYLLVLMPLLWPLFRLPKNAMFLVSLVVFAIFQSLELAGWQNANLTLLSFGLLSLGVYAVGTSGMQKASATLLPSIAGILAYLVTTLLFGPLYWVQLLGVTSILVFFHGVGRRFDGHASWADFLAMIGRYSLFAYIAQIGILQFLRWLLSRTVLPLETGRWLALAGGILLSALAVLIADRLRRRYVFCDKTYRTVFS